MKILKYFTFIAILIGVLFQMRTNQIEETVKGNELVSQTKINQDKVANMMRTAHIDPKTGDFITNPIESNKQLATKQTSLPAVEILTKSNGTIQAKLNGRFRAPLVAQIDCHGKIIMTHADVEKIEEFNCGETK